MKWPLLCLVCPIKMAHNVGLLSLLAINDKISASSCLLVIFLHHKLRKLEKWRWPKFTHFPWVQILGNSGLYSQREFSSALPYTVMGGGTPIHFTAHSHFHDLFISQRNPYMLGQIDHGEWGKLGVPGFLGVPGVLGALGVLGEPEGFRKSWGYLGVSEG